MRVLIAVVMVLVVAVGSWAAQPAGIVLDPNGVSYIYPVLDTTDWVLTQPQASRMGLVPDSARVTHWGDEYYAQDWARGCGATHGHRLYAGISGRVVLAGSRGPYGYTVVIHDPESGFALKYSHLSEVLVNAGEYVLAGRSLIGRVGNTGNVQSSGCGVHPGAHLHLALFKNVTNTAARPITSTSASVGANPTQYAARFGYTPSANLVKAHDDPTVYVLEHGVLYPVSAASFASHGWSFDKHQSVFNALHGRIVTNGSLRYVPQANTFWSPRDHALLQMYGADTVYQFEDSRIQALTYNVFMCRGLRFNEVLPVSAGERPRYVPTTNLVPNNCGSAVRQALVDWQRFAKVSGTLSNPDLSQYIYHPNWDVNWHLRSMPFKYNGGQTVLVYLATHVHDPSNRMAAYTNPQTHSWSGWQRIP